MVFGLHGFICTHCKYIPIHAPYAYMICLGHCLTWLQCRPYIYTADQVGIFIKWGAHSVSGHPAWSVDTTYCIHMEANAACFFDLLQLYVDIYYLPTSMWECNGSAVNIAPLSLCMPCMQPMLTAYSLWFIVGSRMVCGNYISLWDSLWFVHHAWFHTCLSIYHAYNYMHCTSFHTCA